MGKTHKRPINHPRRKETKEYEIMNTIASTLTLGLLAGLASADSISQQVDFEYSAFEGGFIDFERFDDVGGTRQLTGLSLSYDQRIEVDMTIESNGYTSRNAGDWLLDAGNASIHQFGVLNPGGRGGDGGDSFPFIGPGAAFNTFTADLGASDGYNGTGPDTFDATIDESFVFNADYTGATEFGQRMLDTFNGGGTLETFIGGFSELFFQWVNDPNWVVDPNNPPDGPFDGPFVDPYYGIFVDTTRINHSGTITVTYEFSTVPSPSGLVLLGGAGLVATRRRR